jgi:isoamylase
MTRLGAHADADGVTFALYSSVATAVDLVLQDRYVEMEPQEGYVWTARVDGAGHGLEYGYRVHGPGRCNPRKLLLDPYARAISGNVTWDPAVLDPAADSAPFVPRSVVHDQPFDWGEDRHPEIALADSVIYELHVKGFTKLHPEIPEPDRGTFRGLAHPAAIAHLRKLGVTAVELLPVHQFVHDQALVARGLRNYWGYQSIGFFAPHGEYGTVEDFKALVKALHAAGIEVILDVVFNHTAEGGEGGPTLCLRGIDDAAYYRLDADGGYVDDTGCGNTLDTHRTAALRLVMDSLRYWREEMRVDGFRFDLAASLGRGASDFDPHAAFLEAVGQDPVLSTVKLIAEPWDVGFGGYEVGDFPIGWSEWNGRYRDTVRDFWRGAEGKLADFATRIAGSADLYGDDGRRPTASINLVTVHDGFTLADLVSYDRKHNEANGEGNRDGTDDNRSWNCGAEGPTEDPAILALRARQQRNLLATLLLSQGVPLLLAGDELGHTQGGNNNAYCHDDETSWLAWPDGDAPLVDFVAELIALRHRSPQFRRRQVLQSAQDDLQWLRPDGGAMTAEDWTADYARAVAVRLEGTILCFNAWWEPLTFRLPPGAWEVVASTAGTVPGELDARSVMLLRATA